MSSPSFRTHEKRKVVELPLLSRTTFNQLLIAIKSDKVHSNNLPLFNIVDQTAMLQFLWKSFKVEAATLTSLFYCVIIRSQSKDYTDIIYEQTHIISLE